LSSCTTVGLSRRAHLLEVSYVCTPPPQDDVNVETCRESDEFKPISRMYVVIGCTMIIKMLCGSKHVACQLWKCWNTGREERELLRFVHENGEGLLRIAKKEAQWFAGRKNTQIRHI
jgi:hypothetical protein